MEWLDLVHDETGGRQRIPDDDTALLVQQSKGWRIEDPDEDAARAPYVPPRDVDGDGDPDAWVALVHPDLPTGSNVVPNRPEALQGAFEAGWRLPDPPAGAVDERLAELHPRGGRATDAEREQAEHDAAVSAATTDDPASPASGQQDAGEPAEERN